MNIAFVGRKHSGKSTAALMAASELCRRGTPADVYSFAYPIKQMREALLGSAGILTPESKEEPITALPGQPSQRKIEQVLGTEAARDHWHPDFWLGHMALRLARRPASTAALIDDVRFPNELYWVRDQGFHVVWINRPGNDFDTHLSEQALSGYRRATNEWALASDGTFAELADRVEHLIDQMSMQRAIDHSRRETP
ncbi:hypothetical protein [Halorhodospira halophila]|uniref:deoxynucleotide monophosphate kinase family protein n=1 Tax=Halorhodospira halophila TaxID=1053 RepID=UPI00191286A7|nr:hypothetical protein [Halorhodospira halophila]MBK5942752.1 hypothetical protein [Halorhodospira halophila]